MQDEGGLNSFFHPFISPKIEIETEERGLVGNELPLRRIKSPLVRAPSFLAFDSGLGSPKMTVANQISLIPNPTFGNSLCFPSHFFLASELRNF
jgi:hypothetical protein